MTDTITLTGLVATMPRALTTGEGLSITSFRLASTQRRFDRTQNRWVDGETNWYTVTTFRQLAINVSTSVQKGERVVVTGRLRIREWVAGDKNGTNIEVDADAIGHDLTWGTSTFSRSVATTVVDAGLAPGDSVLSLGAQSPAASTSAEESRTTDADGSIAGEVPAETGERDGNNPAGAGEGWAVSVPAAAEVPF